MSPRALFLSASVGVGHTAAAAAVCDALAASDSAFQYEIVDSYKYAASIFSKVVADGYIGMVKTIPQLYKYVYDRAERATELGAFKKWLSQYTASNLRAFVERSRPDVVICTHAFPCGVMSEYKRLYAPDLPVVGIVTDFVVHPLWIFKNIDAYIVATPEIRAVLVARGVARERVHVIGIPISPRFANIGRSKNDLRESLTLPLDRTVVLMMGGGLGIGPMGSMIKALGKVDAPVAGVVIAGKSEAQVRHVLEMAHTVDYPLRVLSFVDNVHEYMNACDILVTKAGGLTASEALAAAIPTVLVKPLPGQEERNTRYLTDRRAAVRVTGVRQLPRVVAQLARSAERREELAERMRLLAHPESAAKAAAIIEALAKAHRQPLTAEA